MVEASDPPAGPALAPEIAQFIEAGRTAWPTVQVPPRLFAEHVSRVLARGTAGASLDDMRGADLYLACACAYGDNEAMGRFEQHYFGELKAVLGRLDGAREIDLDDARQTLREHLFVAPGADALPRVADYSGRGTLRSWMRVAVTRMVLNLVTRGPRETPIDDDALSALLPPTEGLDLQYLKKKYRADFMEALREGAAKLAPRDRNLVSFSLNQRLSIDELGAMYGVHRATAARWLAHAFETLREQVIDVLRARLRLSPEELESVLRLIRSQVEVSLERVLRAPTKEP